MTPLAIEIPSVEFLIFAVALLLGLVGKIVEFAKQLRQKSIEAEQRGERQFGADLGEVPEPPRAQTPPVRLDLVRRPLPLREAPRAAAQPPVVRAPERAQAAQPRLRQDHPVLKLLRARDGARNAIVLAEILGRPKAMRRGR